MMPRIQAAEKLAGVDVAALSHNLGFASELDRNQMLDALRRRAAGEKPPAPVKADPGDLAGMGIGIKGAGEDLPVIGDLEGWLGHPSSSAAVGEQERHG